MKRLFAAFGVLVILSLLAAGCVAPAPAPETVVETVVVEKEVVVTQEVEKEVIVEVAAEPEAVLPTTSVQSRCHRWQCDWF